jgi:hypothetical protein
MSAGCGSGCWRPRPAERRLKAAVLLGWPDTFDAEYVALTQLHADALITLNRQLADAVKDLVTVAPIEALY